MVCTLHDQEWKTDEYNTQYIEGTNYESHITFKEAFATCQLIPRQLESRNISNVTDRRSNFFLFLWMRKISLKQRIHTTENKESSLQGSFNFRLPTWLKIWPIATTQPHQRSKHNNALIIFRNKKASYHHSITNRILHFHAKLNSIYN
jgi:hypothetical protein